MTGFPRVVSSVYGAAVEGGFASTNPRVLAVAGPGGFVAGTNASNANGLLIGRFAWGDLNSTYLDPEGAPTILNNHGSALTAGGAIATNAATITMAAALPAWVVANMAVWDLTTNKYLGLVLTAVSTTLTLAANAANAGSGTSDVLAFAPMPTGIIANENTALITSFLAETSMTIPKGAACAAFTECDIWVKNANSANASIIGQKAFAMAGDGSVQFAAAGATVAGGIETHFWAASVGAAGSLVKISSMWATGTSR